MSVTVICFSSPVPLTNKYKQINMDKLRLTIEKFELTIDIEGLIEETDKDGSGLIGVFE